MPVQMKKLKRWKYDNIPLKQGMRNDSNMYDITVFKSLRFRPSKRKQEPDVLKKNVVSGSRKRRLRVDRRLKQKKSPFSN